jgi:ubiquinone/menaquinone biosynthesis C-methylase UbiE
MSGRFCPIPAIPTVEHHLSPVELAPRLEASAPELYERYLVPAIARLWAADLVERAAPKSGERVLDIACGTGIVARFAAATMGIGHIVGLDINEGMLAVARSRSAGSGPHIEWREASALDLPFPDNSFDLILCQLGLQFFPDQPRALRETSNGSGS